jgi:hypothetical protein
MNKIHFVLDFDSGKTACGRKIGLKMWIANSEPETTCGHCHNAIWRSWEKKAQLEQ